MLHHPGLLHHPGVVLATNLGFPRIGPNRELKLALERYWSGDSSEADLLGAARGIRRGNWALQAGIGLDHVPCNDFSLYDHVLDMAATVGAVPERYRQVGPGPAGLRAYLAMARGVRGRPAQAGPAGSGDLPPLRMTKWFDTNYHYLVPELRPGQEFALEPGVYDVHSPRVPGVEEVEALLRQAQRVLPADRLWVNPDCGLKTRRWEEVKPALGALVDAARRLRAAQPDP